MWILIILIIAVVVWFIWRQSQSGSGKPVNWGGSPGETPLDIAKRRYARGEITKEEFEELKRDLE